MTTISYGQTKTYTSHYIEKNRIVKDTLIDKSLGYKFIIDKNRIVISAIDKKGKLIWKTNPSVDNKLGEYKVKIPKIVYFAFDSDSSKKKSEVIWIAYNNSQFGFLDKKTGKFTFEGQD
ncbi:hypothetical protein C3L50_14470 [Flavobacterium alvei]|uniref:Uncharacterized protein n=1 Tax=Flavobacterium alvei TaxID=2080416 RepID=A0A2S5A4L3_9FLAO|nr:hypothetical protein C3L50_14470 [Flavobacterium alvei]